MSIWKQKVKPAIAKDQPPAGNHAAILVAIVDLGTHDEEYKDPKTGKVNNSAQRKVYLIWDLTGEKRLIGKMYTLSFGKKAGLRKLVESWRGKALAEDEEFDVAKLLGLKCMVNVIHNASGYANIEGVSQLPKGMAVEKSEHKPFIYEYGMLPLPDFSKLPWVYGKKVEEIIAASHEATGRVETIEEAKAIQEEATAEEPLPF